MRNTIYAALGKDFEERVLFNKNDGTPKDLTGFTSEILVTKYFGSSPVVTITGTVETPATSGVVLYSAESTVFDSLGFGTFVYSRYLYTNLGKVDNVITGSFVIMPSVVAPVVE